MYLYIFIFINLNISTTIKFIENNKNPKRLNIFF